MHARLAAMAALMLCAAPLASAGSFATSGPSLIPRLRSVHGRMAAASSMCVFQSPLLALVRQRGGCSQIAGEVRPQRLLIRHDRGIEQEPILLLCSQCRVSRLQTVVGEFERVIWVPGTCAEVRIRWRSQSSRLHPSMDRSLAPLVCAFLLT